MNSWRFVDSLSFLQNSLENLTFCLRDSGHDFAPLFDQSGLYTAETRSERFPLLLRKQHFPYAWACSYEQLRDAGELPDRASFFNELSGGTDISPEDHDFARNVFATFGCTSVLQYCELYCETDVLLLASALISFRETCLETFSLDINYYVSLPAYAFSGEQ